jgi:hypothetical protein
MGEFVAASLAFPAVLFSFLLIVVIGYWLIVLLGMADADTLDGDSDGFADFLAGTGLAGVPVTVVLSLLIALAWFVSLAGTVLLRGAGLPGPVRVALSVGVLLVALAVAWAGTRLVVLPLRRLFASGPAASRTDFVGRLCVIRTGSVGPDFGQAEVTAADGSAAVIQVRQTGDARLTAGDHALIYDLDVDGFFWVMPADALPPSDLPTT